ncbi:MAG: hypothetical protein ACPGRC_02985 [Salibacteraceae bacterium]
MRVLQLLVFAFLFVGLLSCEKMDNEKYNKKKHQYGECGMEFYSFCTDNKFENPNIQSDNLGVIIVKPLVYSDDCNCIVEGTVKYLESGQTVAMVYYYGKDCDSMAKKVLCVDGDCESKKIEICYFYPSNCDTPNQSVE